VNRSRLLSLTPAAASATCAAFGKIFLMILLGAVELADFCHCCFHFFVAAQRIYRCVDDCFLFIIVIPHCSHVLARTIVVWVVFFPKLVQELFVCDFPGIKLGVSLFVKRGISFFIIITNAPYESYVNHKRFSVPFYLTVGRPESFGPGIANDSASDPRNLVKRCLGPPKSG